jgi:hypothetical protein
MYEKNEKFYMHKISQMEEIVPSFQYKPLVLTLELETSYEEEKKRHIDGVGQLMTKTTKEELVDLKGGRDNS